MGITRIRANLQLKRGSVTNQVIGGDSITADKISNLAVGEGLSRNLLSNALDVNVDGSTIDIDSDTLKADPNVTLAGNAFNGANQLVRLRSDGKLPALDGSLLFNLPGGGVGGSWIDLEVPSGDIDGLNKTFVLAHIPVMGSVHFYFNGMLQMPGTGNDYEISGSTVVMDVAPTPGSRVLASYRI